MSLTLIDENNKLDHNLLDEYSQKSVSCSRMSKLLSILVSASIGVIAYELGTRADQHSPLPVVDLGYSVYQASFNVGHKSPRLFDCY
jgi:hypothetical protein